MITIVVMKKTIVQDQKEWALCASSWLEEKQKTYKANSLYIPAGETPKLLYQDWESRKPDFLRSLRMIQIDDVQDGPKKNLFKGFFYEELPSYADQIEYFDQGQTQADLGILGLGLNGHVAFHEPGLPANFYSGCVRLQQETRKNLSLAENTWGKTYGAGAFYLCKALLIIVRGLGKKSILDKVLRADSDIPAATLMSHSDLTIITDFE